MFRTSVLAACLVATSLTARAAEDGHLPTRARSAHTSDEYKRLAAYCHHEAERFDNLAAASREELSRELRHPSGSSKFPTAADRARRWNDYYVEQAKLMRSREENFRKRSNPDEQVSSSSVKP